MNLIHQFGGVYKGITVFLTGHTGFKGVWLSFWLRQLGARVIGYSKDIPSNPSHFELLPGQGTDASYLEDVTDFANLHDRLTEHQPTIVFHLAAQSLVRYSYQHPLETFSTNVMGTANVFEACRQVDSVRAIVNVTSDKCYENQDVSVPFKEGDRMGGHDRLL